MDGIHNGGNEMTQTTIVLNPKRTEYSAEKAAKGAITAAEMIEMLKKFPADARIVVADFEEYMYGAVHLNDGDEE